MGKPSYSEGTWFAVPLRGGGFGGGIAARTTKKGPEILAYLFGPRRETVPTLSEVAEFEPSMAVKVAMIGDLNLISGEWPILGRSPTWQREDWPIPLFVRSSELSRRAFIVRYDDKIQVAPFQKYQWSTARPPSTETAHTAQGRSRQC